ncbi:MAG TPA: CPBP family intramembrane glutamic endopeptidase [Herpetosiphonaceae bacterium]
MYVNQILRERRSTPLIAFGLLAFGISWGVWIPLVLASQGLIALPLSPTLLTLIGAFGPSLAALLLKATTEQWAGVRRLLGRLLIWRVGLQWYLVVLAWPAVLSLLTTAVHVIVGQPAPDFTHPPLLDVYPLPPEMAAAGWTLLVPLIFVQQLLLSSPMGEEIGWRGYTLPRLQTRTSPLVASIVLGLIWSVWHLPLYLTPGHPLANQFFGWLPLGLIPTTILFTWVFNHTRGSLLLALLFHAAINITDLFLARTATLPLISPVLTWLVALLVVRLGDL